MDEQMTNQYCFCIDNEYTHW